MSTNHNAKLGHSIFIYIFIMLSSHGKFSGEFCNGKFSGEVHHRLRISQLRPRISAIAAAAAHNVKLSHSSPKAS